MAADERCDGCEFFEATGASDGRLGQRKEDIVIGICRRFPPIPEYGAETTSIWPRTMAYLWCGEFKRKEAAARY